MVVTFCGHSKIYQTGDFSKWLDIILPSLIEGGRAASLQKSAHDQELAGRICRAAGGEKSGLCRFTQGAGRLKELLTVRANVQKLMGYGAQEREKGVDRREEERAASPAKGLFKGVSRLDLPPWAGGPICLPLSPVHSLLDW